jgi:four helix bundle protein
MGHSYRDLIVWQKAMALVKAVYLRSGTFPRTEIYGLTSQIRRAAVSIPSNIAEGQGRNFDREFSHFVSNALGSLMEVETQLLIAQDLGYLSKAELNQLLKQTAEIGRLANGLLTSLKKAAGAGV